MYISGTFLFFQNLFCLIISYCVENFIWFPYVPFELFTFLCLAALFMCFQFIQARRTECRDGLAYGETGRFPGGPIGRWAGELLTPPTQNLSNTISELGPHLYHVNTVERSKIWRFLVSAPNIIEFCIKNKSVFSKVGRFNNIFPGRIFEPVRP